MSAAPAARLLVLDDEPQIGNIIADVGRDLRMDTRCTTDAKSFLAEVPAWHPTHICLDLIMPDTDGIEVLLRLRSLGCQAGIILVSGAGRRVLEAAQRSAREHGLHIIGALNKPFMPDDLYPLLGETARPTEPETPKRRSDHGLAAVDLMAGIDTPAFDIHLQPKVCCGTGRLAGFEALARWHHPLHGDVPAEHFVAMAEQSGLIELLTNRVLDHALSWLATLDRPELTISVNISPRLLGDLRLPDRLAERCRSHAVDPARVILEITESWAMEDHTIALDILTRLRLKGFHLSIDDFGIGYSSLAQLARLPFSEIKIDRAFVARALESAESRSIVTTIIGLGRDLDLRVTAEGVETPLIFDWLHQAGCHLAQGYHVGRPMPRQAATAWIATHP